MGYRFQLLASGKCLDVRDANPNDGALVQQFTCRIDWNQQWIITEAGAGTWRIKPRFTEAAGLNKCLDVTGGSWDDGVPLQIFACNSGWNQRFYLNGTADQFSISPYNLPDRCVTIGPRWLDDLTQFYQYHCGGPPRPTIQLFKNIA